MQYKSWADTVFYDSLCELPESELIKDRPMLFHNILALLNHVYAMDVVWSSNLEGVTHGFKSRNPDGPPPFEVLRENQKKINAWFQQYSEKLNHEELMTPVVFTFIGGGEGVMTKHEVLQHVVNHASYHRGHIEGVMYQMQIEPPTTDIPVFLKAKNN